MIRLFSAVCRDDEGRKKLKNGLVRGFSKDRRGRRPEGGN